MRNEDRGWIDGDGKVLSLENLVGAQDSHEAEQAAFFQEGAVALSWDEGSVRVRYAPQAVRPGAFHGALRQITRVQRPVTVERWADGTWAERAFPDGRSAVETLREEEVDLEGGDPARQPPE